MVKKRQLWRKHRASPSDLKALWEYRDCVNRFRAKCREMTKQEEKSVVDSKNLGNFYRYVNKRLSHRDAIGALVDESGNVITAD